jgi:cytochrome c-type biogenesis protein CcmE
MKRSALYLLLLIGTGLAILLSTLGQSSSYVDFAEAAANPDRSYHVVGQLDRNFPLVYNPTQDANLLQFKLLDQKGMSMPVVYYGAKPQDFERSEQIVIIGKVDVGPSSKRGHSVFVADQILTKCPSKYTEEEIAIATPNP